MNVLERINLANVSDPREHEALEDKAARVRNVRLPRVRQVSSAKARQAEAPQDQKSHLQRMRIWQREQDTTARPLPQKARRRQKKLGPQSVRCAKAVGQEGGSSTAATLTEQPGAIPLRHRGFQP